MQMSIPIISQLLNGGALPCSSMRYTLISFTGVLLAGMNSIFVCTGSITISGFLPLFLKLIHFNMGICKLEFTMLLSIKLAHKNNCPQVYGCTVPLTSNMDMSLFVISISMGRFIVALILFIEKYTAFIFIWY